MTLIDDRRALLRQIEKARDSRALLYVTGNRSGLEAQITQDVIDLFVDHLDEIGPVGRITLVLETNGGDTMAAWNLVNLIKMFCDELELLAPANCRSAGTLISLGAAVIIMTKQATLGPIDPSIYHGLGPSIPDAHPGARAAVSVEAVMGYLDEIARRHGNNDLNAQAMVDMAQYVHPLVLGEIFRSRKQIRDLAERLLAAQGAEEDTVGRIVEFLCSESGSHDYTINRREARDLGLPIEKCPAPLYSTVRQLRASYAEELQLRSPFVEASLASDSGHPVQYSFTRALIESVSAQAHHLVTEGTALTVDVIDPEAPLPVPIRQVQDHRKFDGWRIMP